jgi:hypothetical protein
MAGGPFIDTRPDFSLNKSGHSSRGTTGKRVYRPASANRLYGPPVYVQSLESAAGMRRVKSTSDKDSYAHVTAKVGSFENISHSSSQSSSRPGSSKTGKSSKDDTTTAAVDSGEQLDLGSSNKPVNNTINRDDNDSDCEYDSMEVRRRMLRSQSAPNVTYNEDGLVKIVSTKLTFKENAESRIGSLDNAKHKAGGGNVKILDKKLSFQTQARSRTDSGLSKQSQHRAKLSLDSSTAHQKPSQTHHTSQRSRSEGSLPLGLPLGLKRFALGQQLKDQNVSFKPLETVKRKVGVSHGITSSKLTQNEENGVQSQDCLEVLRESEEEVCGDSIDKKYLK